MTPETAPGCHITPLNNMLGSHPASDWLPTAPQSRRKNLPPPCATLGQNPPPGNGIWCKTRTDVRPATSPQSGPQQRWIAMITIETQRMGTQFCKYLTVHNLLTIFSIKDKSCKYKVEKLHWQNKTEFCRENLFILSWTVKETNQLNDRHLRQESDHLQRMNPHIFGMNSSSFCGSSHRIRAATRILLRELKHLNKDILEHKSLLNQERNMPNSGGWGEEGSNSNSNSEKSQDIMSALYTCEQCRLRLS